MNFQEPVTLGRTGFKVGRLGISSNYGTPAGALEEAFERGCNYFTYSTFLSRGSREMQKAVRNIVKKGLRDKLVLAVFSYAHLPWLTHRLFPGDLKKLGTDYAEFLILGNYGSSPGKRTLEMIQQLKKDGLVRHAGISSHKRKVFPVLEEKKIVDLFHFRYNAVHRGAEKDIFPFIHGPGKPGMVSFTATNWGKLLNAAKIPERYNTPTAADCYRFVLTNPSIDVCMTGTKTIREMRENLKVLESGPMDETEIKEFVSIGDYLYKN